LLSAVSMIDAAFNMGHRRHFLSFRFRDVRFLADSQEQQSADR
jgi:hypothetical protein